MFGRRKQSVAVPEVGGEAPKFQLPSAQGGQLQLSMRTVRGPVVVAFYRPWSEDDVGYFEALAAKEDEINMAGGSVVGIGVAEAGAAREFARASGIKSYVLYDYARVTSRQWGLLEKSKEHGEHSRPAVFVVGGDHEVAHAWVEERPTAEELLAKVSGITGLPKPSEEKGEEKPKKKEKAAEAGDVETAGKAEGAEEKPKKLSAEERERIKAERRAAREAGKSVKTGEAAKKADTEKNGGEASEAEKPKKMSAEERERIKAERRAARESGKSLKKPQQQDSGAGKEDENEKPAASDEAPKAEETQAQVEASAGAGEGASSGESTGSEEESGPGAEEAGRQQGEKRKEE